MTKAFDAITPWVDGPLAVDGGRGPFDATVHRAEGASILELEPALIDEASRSAGSRASTAS